MRTVTRFFTAFILLCALMLFPLHHDAQNPDAAGYHDHAALSKALRQLAQQHSRIIQLKSIGKSLKGRDIWMLQLTGTRGPDPLSKQALLVVGNAEGDHVIGSEVALGMARHMAENYGKDDKITGALDTRTFYFVPRLNPDGAELFFRSTTHEHSGNLNPRDDDYDWQVDEDGPEDLNGDGLVTWMRVEDPAGEYALDPKEDRLLVKADPLQGQAGEWRYLPEGVDDDEDERLNEDGPGGVNLNRNFPFNYEFFAPDAGRKVTKRRQRFHIIYKDTDFAINLDQLKEEEEEDSNFLEIKSRTWSARDAEHKAELIGELLGLFSAKTEDLVKIEYVDFESRKT